MVNYQFFFKEKDQNFFYYYFFNLMHYFLKQISMADDTTNKNQLLKSSFKIIRQKNKITNKIHRSLSLI